MVSTLVSIPGYRISEELYSGSRTLVYRGYRETDSLPVVIKLLKNPYPNFSELLQFRNQYTIAKNLNSPLIVQTYSLEPYQNGYALVMEDFGGISLKNYFTSPETPYIASLEEFLRIAIALCNALDILYRERIIHKDIKPANILINPETKQVKLIDFSIASLLPRETQTLINPNVLEGTLAYISPEQTGRMNRGIDYRTDFYSLGVTFYELLTGKLPFASNDPMELIHCHIAKVPPSLREVKSEEIPQILSDIVMKLMAKNAEHRYQSALGLKFDLEECLHQLQVDGMVEAFEIASRDVCDRFIIPDKLYGRETEVSILLQAFERVSLGATEMMLVAGFSGIGKTVVVNEVHKPIVRQRGYFIKGKYDQFQRNIPFSAFVQAFRDLMGQLLTESDAQIEQWKNQILEAVGENGQVVIEVIPELSKIIGEQPPAIELSGTAAQNRFNLLFQKFTQVFTSLEHPLVMFLDDLQWADSASLKLMQLLMADTKHLLLIGAYRDNEVNPGHPLMLTLNEIEKNQATINTITLAPLSQDQVNQLVADTLKCAETLAWTLSKLLSKKTQGNPFFATQFLKALHQENIIQFDFELGCWQCDIVQVITLAVTDDVVAFMAFQLRKLPQSTQDILQLAACIGNQFDLATLAIVSEKSSIETAADLWKALQEGLILPLSDVYKFYVGQDCLAHTPENQETVTYKFLHDRVQQAAYSLIPDDQKQATHLQIGQLLQQQFLENEQEERLFDIVGHLNQGQRLISQLSDRQTLAQLNFKAGVKAKTATAYAAATAYFQTAIALLESDCWQTQYELALNLYVASAEASYLNGDFEGMEQQATAVLQQGQTIFDKVKIFEIQIAAQTARSQLLEAIATAKDALAQLGVELPMATDAATIGKALQEINHQLQGREITALIDLPTMSDRTAQAAMQVLGVLFAPVFLGMPGLLPILGSTMVSLSLKFGNAPASTVGYAIHGMVLCAFLGEVETGYGFGKLALSLLEQFNIRELKSITLTLFGTFIQHHKEALNAAMLTLKDGYMAGMETGDFLYAGYSIATYASMTLWAGVKLDTVEPELAVYSTALAQVKQSSAQVFVDMVRETVKNLWETVSQPDCLIGTAYDETVMIPQHHQDNELTKIAVAYIYKLPLAYLWGNYTAALDNIAQTKPYLMAISGLIYVPIFHFYAALAHLTLFSTQLEIEDDKILAVVEAHQTILHQWAQNAPMNHLHKWYLVEAERHRVLGEKIAATECYERAITLAKEDQFINEEALANELAGKFYLDWGKERIAESYMIEAYYGYTRWGAKAKVADLERRYPQLLAPILHQTRSPLSTSETIFVLGSVTSTSSATYTSSVLDTLDLKTILKASQTISGEIELEKLLSSLLSIVIENAGANKCVFMLLRDDRLLIKGSITEGSEPVVLQRLPIEDSQDIPLKLIYKVLHNRQTTVLLDVSADPTLANDPYIMRQQPKSILCSPILHQGKLLGILYLENNLATGAFTNDRVELLNLLCAQAAISLENARLYERSLENAQQLERSLNELSVVQSRFHNLVDNVPGVVYQYRMTPERVISLSYISADCYSLLEITPEQAMSNWQFFDNMVHPDDIASFLQSQTHALQTRSSWHWEGRIVTPSGIIKWIHGESRIEQFADSSVVWDGLFLDISDRKQAEFQIQRQAQADQLLASIAQSINQSVRLDQVIKNCLEQVRQFFQSDRVLICRFDADYNVVIELEVLSQPELSLLGQTIIDPCFDQIWAEHYCQGYITACNDSQAADITPCYGEFLAQMQVQANLAVGILGNDQIWGMMIVHHCHTTHVWQQSEIDLLKQLGLQIGIAHQKANLYTQLEAELGERRLAELALQQKSLDLQQALTDLQNAQLQMVQSEKMSALGNLVAGVAHEMNNPLSFIAASLTQAKPTLADIVEHLKLYQENLPNPAEEIIEHAEEIDLDYSLEDLPKMIDSMSMACDRLKNISTSLRTFSRADQDYKVPFNIHEGIDSTILILKHRLKANEQRPAIGVVTNYGNLPQIECFPGQLNQVFMNLLANAIDALDESNHGRSFQEIKANPNCIVITTSVENNLVKIAIADNGKGMNESVKSKIFDHLFTTKAVGKGTGLGLAIARQIVESTHGGKLSCNSVLGEGTELIIEIPV